jgi:uroporphyrinogen-III synthase
VNDAYNGILFFSPSAVHSFFKKNKANPDTVFFAIGETTANAISVYTNNKIITGNTPAKGELLKLAVEWLSTTNKFQV